jgi:hypothetical protein
VKLLEDTEEAVRKAALQTTSLALKLGLIHPLTCVNQLLCLLSDRQPLIANKAFALITTVMDKTPECVWSRLATAISASYHFQRALWKDAKSVVWDSDESKPGESLFGRLFSLSKKERAATRSLRLSFLANAIKLFDVPLSSPVDLGLMRYIADALGYLTFTNIEEPLCLIYHINRMLALKGEPALSAIKSAKEETNPQLANHAGAITLLVQLKNFLKQSYSLTEAKCKSYMPSSGSTSSLTGGSSSASADMPLPPPLSKAEKDKEKEIQANPEVRKKSAAIAPLPSDPKALVELFRKTMKADTSDTLAIAAQPTGKTVRRKAKRSAAAEDDEEEEGGAPKKKGKKSGKKKASGGRRRKAAESEDSEEEGEVQLEDDD